jgi:hypothetical protein
LRKHVNSDNHNILKKFEEDIDWPLREDEKQPSEKKPNIYFNSKSNFAAK